MTGLLKRALLKTAQRGGLFLATRRWSRKDLRVLAYHGIWTTPGYRYGDRLFITLEQFDRRMTWLRESAYPILPLDEAVRLLNEGSLPDNSVVITIDDGWVSTYTHMLPMLERLNLPATIYVTTWYSEHQMPVIDVAIDYLLKRSGRQIEDAEKVSIIAYMNGLSVISERDEALRRFAAELGINETDWCDTRQFRVMTPGEIGDAHRRGFDIQLHTHCHWWGKAPPDRLQMEIARNRAVLASACGMSESDFSHFCYPSGYLNPAGDDVLRSSGIKSAMMVDQGINSPATHPYRLRRFMDGHSVSQASFEAYLSGALEFYETALKKFSAI